VSIEAGFQLRVLLLAQSFFTTEDTEDTEEKLRKSEEMKVKNKNV
jgi:hypothetical protein